ncbi:MAG TPA: hypothetical protein VFQ39_11295, partial [Longimicrobium sp.]|nr:hypothetical protein [Longimicrobium sp.]
VLDQLRRPSTRSGVVAALADVVPATLAARLDEAVAAQLLDALREGIVGEAALVATTSSDGG